MQAHSRVGRQITMVSGAGQAQQKFQTKRASWARMQLRLALVYVGRTALGLHPWMATSE